MRVGLVLGAGGVVGGSWLVGALEALQSETGWDPSEAEVICGTSAGSVVGALTAAGISPSLMAAYSTGGSLEEIDELDARVDLAGGRLDEVAYRLKLALPPIGPGSWRMAINTALRPMRHAPSAVLSAWLPRGFISTDPIAQLVERFIADDWPDHPNYWAVTADYASGKRCVFGRDGSPPAKVGEAVAASCAIPGFYHPVKISGRRYIDGGICSVSNLDLLCDEDLDLVVCLNPMSSLAQVTPRSPAQHVAGLMRRDAGRRVGREAKKLRERGTEVLILQPTAEDLAVMGVNLMAKNRREEVIERAVRSTARQLRRRRGREGVVLPAKKKTPAKRQRAVSQARRKAA
jgi:NTE family protein